MVLVEKDYLNCNCYRKILEVTILDVEFTRYLYLTRLVLYSFVCVICTLNKALKWGYYDLQFAVFSFFF